MLGFTRSQLQPVGIDIGHSGVRMLQIELAGDGLQVRAAAREDYPPEVQADPALRLPAAMEAIRRLFAEGAFRGREAVVNLPREIVRIKNLRLPVIPPVELDNAVALEARDKLGFDTDMIQVRHIAAGEVRQNNETLLEVIAVGAADSDIDNFVEQLARAKVVPAALDVEPCALFRCVERFVRRREDEHEVHVLADVGFAATLVVIGRGREISFVKYIDLGVMHLEQALSRRLGVSAAEARVLRQRMLDEAPGDDAARHAVRQALADATRGVTEQLAREISLCLRYQSVTFRGHRPARVRLMGAGAYDPQLQSILAAAVTIPVEAGRPLFNVDTRRMSEADRDRPLSEWAMALGLALRFARGPFAPRDGRPRGASPPQPPPDEAASPAAPEEAVHA